MILCYCVKIQLRQHATQRVNHPSASILSLHPAPFGFLSHWLNRPGVPGCVLAHLRPPCNSPRGFPHPDGFPPGVACVSVRGVCGRAAHSPFALRWGEWKPRRVNAPSRRSRLLYTLQQHHLQSFGVSVSGTKMRGFRKNVSSGLDVFLGEQTGMCECEAAYSDTGCNPSGARDMFLSNDLRSTVKMLISTSWASRRSLIETHGGVRMVTPHSFTNNIVVIPGRPDPSFAHRVCRDFLLPRNVRPSDEALPGQKTLHCASSLISFIAVLEEEK